jgi:hypothetical protein
MARPQAGPMTEIERTRLLHGHPTMEDSNGCRESPLIGSTAVLGSLFVQTVFWRAIAYLSWALVSLLTIRMFDSVELFGLISAALLVLGSLPALDGGFRNTLNRRILGRARDEETFRMLQFGQRLYSWFCAAVAVLGTVILCAYSLTPNARSLHLPWAFYPLLGAVSGVVALGSAFLQLLTGLGQQRRMFMLQLCMAWASIGILWIGFRAGLGIWSFVLSQSLPSLAAMALAAPVIRAEAPGLRLLDFAWSREDSDRLKELWPESSGLMRFQFWTLLVYTFDAMLVAWLCQGKLVGQYLLVANLFSKLRLLLQSADDAVWPILAAKTDKAETIAEGVLRFNGWLWGAVHPGLHHRLQGSGFLRRRRADVALRLALPDHGHRLAARLLDVQPRPHGLAGAIDAPRTGLLPGLQCSPGLVAGTDGHRHRLHRGLVRQHLVAAPPRVRPGQ